MGRWSLELRYAGEVLEADLDLTAELSRSLEAGTSTTDPLEVSLPPLIFPIDVAALEEAGHRLDAAEGDLYLDGKLVLRGRVVDPEYADPQEAPGWMSISLRSSPLEDRSIFPPPAAAVTAETWPDHDPACTGRSYPWVFGAPGTPDYAGSPAYLVQSSSPAPAIGPQFVLVAYGHTTAASVTLLVPSGGSKLGIGADEVVNFSGYEATFTIIHTHDALGTPCSVVDLWETTSPFQPDLPWYQGTEFYARWDFGPASSGNMGNVLDFMLRQSSVAIDYGRLEPMRAALNGYSLAGYIDEPVVPVEWLADNPIPLVQVALVSSEEGLHPMVWPADRTAARAVAHLVEGPDCEAIGGVRRMGEPLNQLTLRYKPRADADEYLGIVVIDPTNDPYAEASRRRYAGDAQNGVYAEDLETDVVHDDATAQAMARERVRRFWSRERVAEYRVWPEIWRQLERGDLVTITSHTRGWTRRPAVIGDRSDDEDAATLALVIDDDVFRDS